MKKKIIILLCIILIIIIGCSITMNTVKNSPGASIDEAQTHRLDRKVDANLDVTMEEDSTKNNNVEKK